MAKTTTATILLALLTLVAATTAVAQEALPGSEDGPMPIYVTPFYDSEGPQVAVGEFSERLARADAESIVAVMGEMREKMASLPATAMYVAAVRLYDLGRRDESLYWFYSAQLRARLFQALLDPEKEGGIGAPAFELASAHGAFQQLAGAYVNGYAGCDRDRWLAVLGVVASENGSPTDLAAIYPAVAFLPKERWSVANEEIVAGLGALAEMLKEDWAMLEAARAENGADAMFCGE